MTLLEGVNRVKFRSHRGDQNITNDQTTADIIMCFNEALGDMATKLPKESFRSEATVNVVQGTEIYSIIGPGNYPVQELLAVPHYPFNGTSYNLRKIESEAEFWGQFYVFNAAQSRPYIYCEWGLDASKNLQIRVFPIPNASYTLTCPFEVDPTAVILTASDLNTELPLYQPYLQKAWVMGAIYYFLDSFDDPKTPLMEQRFKDAMINQDAAEQDDITGDLQFRISTGRTRFVDPATGIRLQ